MGTTIETTDLAACQHTRCLAALAIGDDEDRRELAAMTAGVDEYAAASDRELLSAHLRLLAAILDGDETELDDASRTLTTDLLDCIAEQRNREQSDVCLGFVVLVDQGSGVRCDRGVTTRTPSGAPAASFHAATGRDDIATDTSPFLASRGCSESANGPVNSMTWSTRGALPVFCQKVEFLFFDDAVRAANDRTSVCCCSSGTGRCKSLEMDEVATGSSAGQQLLLEQYLPYDQLHDGAGAGSRSKYTEPTAGVTVTSVCE